MLSCPCGEARIGAALVTIAIYWLSLSGVSPMFGQIAHGNPAGIVWALVAGGGVICIATGLAAALTHDDAFRPGSFLWSVGVIGFCGYAVLHHLEPADSAQTYRIVHGFLLAWAASNAINLWLQLRGPLGRRHAAVAIQEEAAPTLRRRRRIMTEWLEEIEGHGIDAVHTLPAGYSATHLPAHTAPGVIEHDGSVPQLVYVKQGDRFVPVHLADAVPVERRLR